VGKWRGTDTQTHTQTDVRERPVYISRRLQQQPFYSPLSGTIQVRRYQKKHSPTHHPDHHPIFISFFHLPRSIASSLFKLRAWQSCCTTSFHVLYGLPLGLEPSTSYSIHFFTQTVSSFRSMCPYQICTGTNIHTCMTCTDYRIWATSTNKWPHHIVHASLYTTTLLVYPHVTTSTLYWITTNTSATYTTWPSCSLLQWLLTFSTYHT